MKVDDVNQLVAALAFLTGGEPAFECGHGVPLEAVCEPTCETNVVRLALAAAKRLQVAPDVEALALDLVAAIDAAAAATDVAGPDQMATLWSAAGAARDRLVEVLGDR